MGCLFLHRTPCVRLCHGFYKKVVNIGVRPHQWCVTGCGDNLLQCTPHRNANHVSYGEQCCIGLLRINYWICQNAHWVGRLWFSLCWVVLIWTVHAELHCLLYRPSTPKRFGQVIQVRHPTPVQIKLAIRFPTLHLWRFCAGFASQSSEPILLLLDLLLCLLPFGVHSDTIIPWIWNRQTSRFSPKHCAIVYTKNHLTGCKASPLPRRVRLHSGREFCHQSQCECCLIAWAKHDARL